MKFAPMTEDHIAEAQALTTSFNWPHTVEDWSFAFGLGSGRVACAGSKLVGVCLTWKLGSGVSTLGLLAVSQEAQGRGLGRALLKLALEDQTGQTILLHATQQAIDLYKSENFAPIGEIRQFQGVVRSGDERPHAADIPTVNLWKGPLTAAEVDHILTLDFEATGTERCVLLRALMPLSELYVMGSRADPNGYALVRAFGRGHAIGPVIARSAGEACGLVTRILDSYTGRFVRIDLTEHLIPSGWLSERGVCEVDRVLAMSNGPMPQGSGQVGRFGLIGHAFG